MFTEDLTFTSKQTTTNKVFSEIAKELLKRNLVTTDFLENLISREESYPTGMDMSIVSPNLPNIAIPHTETEFVKTCAIIPIKLETPISFYNMISPQEQLEVTYLFMILNNDPHSQAGMLASIMDFMVQTDSTKLEAFFKETNSYDISQFLNKHLKL